MARAVNVLSLVLFAMCLRQCHAGAHLLVSKIILNEHIVEGKDMTVQYTIYNVGTSAAQSVFLNDESFSPEDFKLDKGLLSASWDRILQKGNVTHTVIVAPLAPGVFNISWAQLTYKSVDSDDRQVGFSNSPGFIQVVPYPDYSRKFEHHVVDWLAFAVMSLPTVLLPWLLWYRSSSKYESIKKTV